MPCKSDLVSQTEFEFLQGLKSDLGVESCCGTLVELGLADPTLTQFHQALHNVGVSRDYLDVFDTRVLDCGVLAITMCSKHWIKHIQALGTLATTTSDESLANLTYHLFRLVCLGNEWDYKEIINYLKSANSVKQRE